MHPPEPRLAFEHDRKGVRGNKRLDLPVGNAARAGAREQALIDLRLYFRVFWRFKPVVVSGLILAAVLATLSFAKVSFVDGRPTIAFREHQIWEAQESLLITQQGFTEGRTIFPESETPTGSSPIYADPGRLAGLAEFYAWLASSDAVKSRIPRKPGQLPALMSATPVSTTVSNQSPLPVLQISGAATTPANAIALTLAATEAFRNYLAERQSNADIPVNQRVIVSVLNLPKRATVVEPRKKTIPIMVFLAVMGATFGLVLILENLRPRVRVVDQVSMKDIADHRPQHPPITGVGRADAGR